MYRIIKRIVHTVTTVTWLVHLEDSSGEGRAVEKQITFPASYSITEEDVSDLSDASKRSHPLSNPDLDCEASPKRDEGEKS